MGFARFMASIAGRVLRVVLGVVLIGIGFSLHTTTGFVIAGIGLVPIVAGIFNLCLFAPLFGGPLRGSDLVLP